MRRSALLTAFLVAISSLALFVTPTASAAIVAPKSSVAKPFVGQKFDLTGDFGSGARPVKLQHYVAKTKKWTDDQTGSTKDDGTYRFTTSTKETSLQFRAVAPASGSKNAIYTLGVTITTRVDAVRLVLSRNRTTGLASGFISVKTTGRLWALQVDKSDTWVQVGDKVAEKDGRVTLAFPLGEHNYRLVGDKIEGSAGAYSNHESSSTGPKTLGKHVLYVMTKSGTTPTKKGRDYTATTGIDDAAPVDVETIAVRGNSGARKPKKPYKLKFIDQQTPLGLPKGKTFDLLPNYQDHSLIRTAVGIGAVAGNLTGMEWAPHRAFTELFINGKYLGSYEIIESIKIQPQTKKNDARIPISEDTGVIIEINPNPENTDVPGKFKGSHGMYYGFKDPDEVEYEKDGKTPTSESVTKAKTDAMEKRIRAFEKVLYSKDFDDPETGWTKYLDMKSAVDYYLAKEYIKDWDGDFYRSNFFYTDDYADPKAKFKMGPIWDTDRSAAAKDTLPLSAQSPKGWFLTGEGVGHPGSDDVHTKHWFVRITKDKAFQKALRVRWEQKHWVFRDAGDKAVDAAVAELGTQVAANDRALWQKSQPDNRYGPRASSYKGEISFVKDWYQDRYRWMKSKLG